ncbi:uncharacterized protein NPIL_140181 [Nephila pilipes]|uniref:Uncharacterized protein n=1 Tax=Nephila pilipes TaxID=299642 RepID=A0A8X6QLL7_NEPPI|nr:uncharacterized protein NPIL_140181 [Nephila pilipes]
MCMVGILILFWIASSMASESDAQPLEQNERSGRSWHQSLFGPQMLMQHQQNPSAVSTSQPGDGLNPQNSQQQAPSADLKGPSRNFEEHDKNAVPAGSEQDFMSRHFGYLNVHRFDPNFPYYDRNAYPRFPSPHAPRFGPGYRKDKYGHGYGYSCKQGDDCDEVKAANQVVARIPAAHSPHPFHPNPMTPFGNPYPDLDPFPSMPSYPNMPAIGGSYGNHFGAPPPARFSDPHPPPMQQSMMPSRFYYGRYLHDQEERKTESKAEAKATDN